MRRKKMIWYLYPSYLLVIILSLTGIYWYAMTSLRQFCIEQSVADLTAKIKMTEDKFSEMLVINDRPSIDVLCKTMGKKVQTRFTVFNPAGKVIGDTDQDPALMDNHIDRPEIIDALKGNEGVSIRFSFTLHEKMIYVVKPLLKNDTMIGLLRASVPELYIKKIVSTIQLEILLVGLVIAFLSLVISFALYHKISSILKEIKSTIERFAYGDLDLKLRSSGIKEIDNLIETVNGMADQLHKRITSLTSQRNELEAVLSGMVEGVFAVDMQERFIRMNEAAGKMLNVSPANVQGRSIQEVLKNSYLQKFIARTLSGGESAEDEVSLEYTSEERFLQVHGTVLHNEQHTEIGALIVLNDITRLRRLENIRRDFVANVSHELKTPITSIKASVETLLDLASQIPGDAKRFLDILARHTERLDTIINDLLSLARIEQETKRSEIVLKESKIKDVLESVIQLCESKSESKAIHIELNCREDIRARINVSLLEQAMMNLIDNAIKYSESGQPVQIKVERIPSEVVLSITDHGCGIEQEHLSRLFERFYRVDKGRSRELGGTGLGLAIVKHVVVAHHGTVTVESAIGKGSTFSIHLPVL